MFPVIQGIISIILLGILAYCLLWWLYKPLGKAVRSIANYIKKDIQDDKE
jgi:cbb3-type cytochrome oxidase subunit 3